MKRNNKKGFTIVELVIVIAVIAILSAVLIPTFGNIVERAQATAAQQEARNTHTEYVAAWTPESGAELDVDFVCLEDVYYAVDGDFLPGTPEHGDLILENGSVEAYCDAEAGECDVEGCVNAPAVDPAG